MTRLAVLLGCLLQHEEQLSDQHGMCNVSDAEV